MGYGICLFRRPGFVILKQNRGVIRDRKYARGAENNPRENGIERNFESGWQYLTLFWTLIVQFLMWPCINMQVVKLAIHLLSVFHNKVAYTLVLRFVISPFISALPNNFLFTLKVLVAHDELVITTSWDETIRMWNVMSGTCLLTLRGHTEGIYFFLFYSSIFFLSINSFLAHASSCRNWHKIKVKNNQATTANIHQRLSFVPIMSMQWYLISIISKVISLARFSWYPLEMIAHKQN